MVMVVLVSANWRSGLAELKVQRDRQTHRDFRAAPQHPWLEEPEPRRLLTGSSAPMYLGEPSGRPLVGVAGLGVPTARHTPHVRTRRAPVIVHDRDRAQAGQALRFLGAAMRAGKIRRDGGKGHTRLPRLRGEAQSLPYGRGSVTTVASRVTRLPTLKLGDAENVSGQIESVFLLAVRTRPLLEPVAAPVLAGQVVLDRHRFEALHAVHRNARTWRGQVRRIGVGMIVGVCAGPFSTVHTQAQSAQRT